jgi:hypothetical protein
VTHGSTGAPLLGRQSPELWDTCQHRSSPLRKAEPGAVGHVTAPELTSLEARSEAEGHVAVSELTLARRRGLRPRYMWRCRSPPLHGGEVWS